MRSNEIRRKFQHYFQAQGHIVLPSASLVPADDPTLLFTNAGMVPFKNYFLGLESPPYRRVTTVQKCVRAGGKHNDLEVVGKTARHHTFFEMLGNFSFGDYFKKEAIAFAWEFLTGILGLAPERLWVTVYEEDEEAHALWQKEAGVPPGKIVHLGVKDNFWAMAETGPCGPCSEVIIDRGEKYACGSGCGLGLCDCDRWLELWNLVFMQFERNAAGELSPLPRPSIDTGMGLERVTSILQGVESNFETDLLWPLIVAVTDLVGKKYEPGEGGFPFRVIADHVRACAFLIADGVVPSNEGRGYVLRRILRRAARFGRDLGLEKPFLSQLVPMVVKILGEAYPEVKEKEKVIKEVVSWEETRFQETLTEGMRLAFDFIVRAKEAGRKELSGAEAFKLYDTFGFPLDLTRDLAVAQGLRVDEEGFALALEAQRARAREARATEEEEIKIQPLFRGIPPTFFTGYRELQSKAQVLGILEGTEARTEAAAGEEVAFICDVTPFYPEGGGQMGDTGVIFSPGGWGEIQETQRLAEGQILHWTKIKEGKIKVGEEVELEVDMVRRQDAAANHSATHLLHKALKEILGNHVHQAGSLVTPERLRFDFTHFSGLTPAQLQTIEAKVNAQIQAGLPVTILETSFAEAKVLGAVALFGEKYGEKVRVVKIGDYSLELCGGTHVENTREIGAFKILSESSIGAGLRRLEAVTGKTAWAYFKEQEERLKEIASLLKTGPETAVEKVKLLLQELKAKEKEISVLQLKLGSQQVQELAARAREVEGVKVVSAILEGRDVESLRQVADLVRNRLGSGVVVLGTSVGNGKAGLVVMVTRDLLTRGLHAGKLAREIAVFLEGSGGGKPEVAQAGGRNPAKLGLALEKTFGLVEKHLQESIL